MICSLKESSILSSWKAPQAMSKIGDKSFIKSYQTGDAGRYTIRENGEVLTLK